MVWQECRFPGVKDNWPGGRVELKPRLGLRLTLALLDFVGDRLRDLTDRVDRDRKARDLRRRVTRSGSDA